MDSAHGADHYLRTFIQRMTGICDKRQPWQWEKIPGHERNEVLDCRNYAMAAFKALPADLDKIDRKLKEMSGARRESVSTPSVTAPAARPQARQKNRTLERYYDDW